MNPKTSWSAAGSEAPRRLGTMRYMQVRYSVWMAKAVSPLRSATAVQNNH
jgi:hypothetical protein